MGVYIGLDIIPHKITLVEWRKVYEESLQLLAAYPFATIVAEKVGEAERLVLDVAKEQYINEYGQKIRCWETCGDLKSKKTGETFKLFADLSRYKDDDADVDGDTGDILFINDEEPEKRTVFYAKTQGYPYHIYILAIAALIESRLQVGTVEIYGDISKEQAEIAVNWANSILEQPIYLSTRVNCEALHKRVKNVGDEDKQVDKFFSLMIAADENRVDGFAKDNFNEEAILRYFREKIKQYTSPAQLGAQQLMIRLLNMGVDLAQLCDIYCLDSKGPQYNSSDFIEALCSTWIFIPQGYRTCMNAYKRSPELPSSVDSQLGTMYLDMSFIGWRINRYISLEEVKEVLHKKFEEVSNLEEILSKKYEEVVKLLEEKQKVVRSLVEQYEQKSQNNLIDDCDELMYWDTDTVISKDISDVIKRIREVVEEAIQHKDYIIAQKLHSFESNIQFLEYIIRLTRQHGILLTREAWNWVDNVEDHTMLKKMVIMLLTSENSEIRKIYKAMLSNKKLFLHSMIN